MMLESLHVEKNMGGLSAHVVNVLSICLQEHWTYVESLGLAKLPGEEPCGVTWSLVDLLQMISSPTPTIHFSIF